LADGLLPSPPVPLERYVAPHPHFTPDRGAAAHGQGYAADSGDHERPEYKTVEESAPISGYDGHKNVKWRKRHLRVDNLGLPLSVHVTPADAQDRAGARCLLETVGLGNFTAIPLRTGRGILVCTMVNYRKLVVLQDKLGKNEQNRGTFS
jgi:hypothetical protein